MITSKIKELNDKFGISGCLNFEKTKGNFISAKIKNTFAEAEISLHGAHVMSFIPHGNRDVLWTSKHSYYEDAKPIRGGIPICWPWFGAHPKEQALPSHGFVRLFDWNVKGASVLDNGATQVKLVISGSDKYEKFWNYPFLLEIIVTGSDKLELELIATNTGTKTFSCTAALHSYFNINSISDIFVEGLDGCEYISTVGGLNKQGIQKGNIHFNSEFDNIYLNTIFDCLIHDPGFKRKIRVSKSGSRTTVVWNPWIAKSAKMPDFGNDEYKEMLCVEAVNTLNDTINIAPGKSHSLKTAIKIENL